MSHREYSEGVCQGTGKIRRVLGLCVCILSIYIGNIVPVVYGVWGSGYGRWDNAYLYSDIGVMNGWRSVTRCLSLLAGCSGW